MDKELSKLSLSELIEPFTPMQKAFLSMVARGVERLEARRLCNIKYTSLCNWEHTPEFKEIEKHVIENQAIYKEQALNGYFASISECFIGILRDLMEKGYGDWKKCSQSDKKYIMKAMEMVMKLGLQPKGRAKDKDKSYEAWLEEEQ